MTGEGDSMGNWSAGVWAGILVVVIAAAVGVAIALLGRSGSKPPSANSSDDGAADAMMKVFIGYDANEDGFPADPDAFLPFARDVEDALNAALKAAGVGSVDGNEFGGNSCVIYAFGPETQGLWDVGLPVLKGFTYPREPVMVEFWGPGSDDPVGVLIGKMPGED